MIKPPRRDETYNEYVKDFYRHIEDYDWNKVTDNFSGLESFLHRYRQRETLKLIKQFGQGDHYLDVGCGTGLILRHLPPGSVGYDINPRHVKRAQAYAPHATVRLGDAENLDLPETAYSTAVCTETIEHLVFPEKAIAHIHRALKPSGMFIGSTPAHALLWRLRFLSSTHFHNEPFHNEFNLSEIKSLLSNFRIIQIRRQFFGSMFFFVCQKQ